MTSDQAGDELSGITSLPVDTLDEIAQARYPQYSPEAVTLAREELSRRGFDWAKRAKEEATGETEAEAARHPAGTWWKVWPTLCALSGLAVFVLIGQYPGIRETKSVLYLGCAALDLIALGYVNDFRLWRDRSVRAQTRAVVTVSFAIAFSLWCVLCLVGVVNY